jgi:hypothetical protein
MRGGTDENQSGELYFKRDLTVSLATLFATFHLRINAMAKVCLIRPLALLSLPGNSAPQRANLFLSLSLSGADINASEKIRKINK